MDFINNYLQQAMELGATFGVNPIIFATIYIGAIPFFSLSIAWLVKRYKQNLSITAPVVAASFFFFSAYLYAFIFGENLPTWFYIVLIFWIIAGGIWTIYSTRKKL